MRRTEQNRWSYRLREPMKSIGVRVTLFSVGGVALALLTAWLSPMLPWDMPIQPASGSVDSLLNVVATAMLPVATFSVSIIVTAYGAAAGGATPRATRLLAADPTAQTAVAVFIGAFMFAIVGIIGLAAGAYEDAGRPFLFIATLGVIILIAWALLRWVHHLSQYGRIGDIIARVETEAVAAARYMRDNPTLGARPVGDGLGDDAIPLANEQAGYVQHIDVETLNNLAEQAGVTVEIRRMPGNYAHYGEPLLRLSAPCHDVTDKMRDAFTIGTDRDFEQDVRYGLIVLSEIATRALPPMVNDPGTVISVLRSGTRILTALHGADDPTHAPAAALPRFAHVLAPELDMATVYREFFAPVARDGANLAEVMQTLLDCLDALEPMGGGDAARDVAQQARMRAEKHLTQGWELDLLR
ncbi:DUF2254 domain-containing protein [Paracoccus sp. (in: a-proteobacteria)]|uniref:DUF2254 domain-containing protein n=1 Tax=Paracoccus sp. TaxID=267 RepID=UPI0026DF7647|nr:DUF2254 domain-containing protein [Paracoccus sp. (in: a-proteobacteria)]MDO5647081.1 DUF2254 domain-containing protein [Paracoccus sp. (in: a-proteobacteria)]